MTQENTTQRHRRGDPSPVDSSLLFLRYKRGKEVWVTRERLDKVAVQARKVNAKQRTKPEHKEYMKLYFREYNHLPKQKEYRSAYYKQSEVRARVRGKYAVISTAKKQAKAAMITPEYLQKKKEARTTRIRAYDKARYQIPVMRIAKICRARIIDAVKYAKAHKFSKTVVLLGCSYAYFKKWIEAKWKKGMSWANFGEWHIDHILPVISFDLTTLAGQLQCFRFTNTQPLWKDENLSKGAKLIFA